MIIISKKGESVENWEYGADTLEVEKVHTPSFKRGGFHIESTTWFDLA